MHDHFLKIYREKILYLIYMKYMGDNKKIYLIIFLKILKIGKKISGNTQCTTKE